MNREAYEYLEEKLAAVKVLDFGDRQYTTKKIFPVHEPRADTLTLTSLSGLVEYLTHNLDKVGDVFAQVVSPTRIKVMGPMKGPFRQRDTFVVADCERILPETHFGAFMDQEAFVIMLRSAFLDADALAGAFSLGMPLSGEDANEGDLEYAARVAAALVDDNSVDHIDDGTTQTVTLKSGVRLRGTETLKNPVLLRPWRTFVDVKQPMSAFLLRVRPGGLLALIEADGGAWRLDAMKNVQAELEFMLDEAGVDFAKVIA